jgi:hypothetical protein
MMGVPIIDLTPQTHFRPDDILLILVPLNIPGNMLVMQIHPRQIISIRYTIIVPDTHIKIKRSIVREHDLVFCGRITSAPPVDDVALFNVNETVQPVHWGFGRVQLLDDLVLLSTVLALDLMLLDFLLLDELCLVFEAGEGYFIAAQVNDRVGEDVDYLGEDLLDQFVGLFQSYIKWSHVPAAKCTGDVLVLWGFSPAGCVARGVQFWDDSDAADHSVTDKLTGVVRGVGLLLAEGSVLGDFGVTLENQGECVFIRNMPMKNTQLIVHHSINSLIQQMHRQKVPRCINHQPSVNERRLILNENRQMALVTVLVGVPLALE